LCWCSWPTLPLPWGGHAANVRQSGFTEDDSSDSAASSEFSTTQVGGSINGALPRGRTYLSEGYASSVPSRMNVKSTTKKVWNGGYDIDYWGCNVPIVLLKNC